MAGARAHNVDPSEAHESRGSGGKA